MIVRDTMGRRAIPYIILLVGIAAMAIGIALGEPSLVFKKASKICLSCIGI